MLKFKFDYQANTLAYRKPWESWVDEFWYEITETFAGNFDSQGFQLADGWITFTVYEKKIRVFYKQIQPTSDPDDFWEPQPITYFRKDLPKACPVIFTFSKVDRVEKVAGSWVKKGESTM